jgi:hypothetical protein
MLDEHIQLHQPLTFPEPLRDWWYVDLVEVTESGDTVSPTIGSMSPFLRPGSRTA